VAIVNLIFTGAVFPNINIADTAPDILICTMASIAILEKNMTAAVLGLICGLILDVFFTGTIGFYAIPYFATGAILRSVCNRIRYYDKLLLPMLIAFGACIGRDLISALIAYMMAIDFSFGRKFLRYTLPDAAQTAVLMILIYFIFTKIYQHSVIKQKSPRDFSRLE
jgi:rod shape-determining protein MreD